MRLRQALAVILGLIGLVWLGQGVGLISGSFMTGSVFWAVTGGVLVLVAVGLWWWDGRIASRR